MRVTLERQQYWCLALQVQLAVPGLLTTRVAQFGEGVMECLLRSGGCLGHIQFCMSRS